MQDNTASTTPASTVSPTVSPTVSSTTPDNHKADLIGYDNQIDILKKAQADYASANETEEERKKREKREKSKRVIAAVGDGIRALSNLYFTSQYAPNMYNPDDTQLAKVDARQEKLKAEREANRDKYLNYSLRIGDLENDRAKTVREMEAQAERLRLAREKLIESRKSINGLQTCSQIKSVNRLLKRTQLIVLLKRKRLRLIMLMQYKKRNSIQSKSEGRQSEQSRLLTALQLI